MHADAVGASLPARLVAGGFLQGLVRGLNMPKPLCGSCVTWRPPHELRNYRLGAGLCGVALQTPHGSVALLEEATVGLDNARTRAYAPLRELRWPDNGRIRERWIE